MLVLAVDLDRRITAEECLDETVAVVGAECYRLYAFEQAAVKIYPKLEQRFSS